MLKAEENWPLYGEHEFLGGASRFDASSSIQDLRINSKTLSSGFLRFYQ